jgi:hypothetical protein
VSIDGFFPRQTAAFEAMSLASVDRFYRFVNALGVRLGVVVEGIEHLPPGRALLVANHTFGFDVTFPMGEIYKRTGRVVWASTRGGASRCYDGSRSRWGRWTGRRRTRPGSSEPISSCSSCPAGCARP